MPRRDHVTDQPDNIQHSGIAVRIRVGSTAHHQPNNIKSTAPWSRNDGRQRHARPRPELLSLPPHTRKQYDP